MHVRVIGCLASDLTTSLAVHPFYLHPFYLHPFYLHPFYLHSFYLHPFYLHPFYSHPVYRHPFCVAYVTSSLRYFVYSTWHSSLRRESHSEL